MSGEPSDKMELRHDPVPGYRPFFFIILAAGVIYLALIFYYTL
ncbi:MAG: hypothetical protein PHW74_01750 [Desulfobacca sp.]|nr:hypothetical protein [Desulfobacca sp.]